MISDTTSLRDVSGVKKATGRQSVEYGESRSDAIDIAHLYTPLSVAREEIWRRWNDTDLKEKVTAFLGEVPKVFLNGPNAGLFRFIATPNLECDMAMELSKLMGLRFLFLEYLDDKFCTRNVDKVFLGKINRISKIDVASKNNIISERLIDFEKNEGKAFRWIKTLNGRKMTDVHHELFQKKYDSMDTFDVSELKIYGDDAHDLYLKIFSIFTCFGVLFENYLVSSNKNENEFTMNIIYPAFRTVEAIYGLKPLIVPLMSYKDEDGYKIWQYYLT